MQCFVVRKKPKTCDVVWYHRSSAIPMGHLALQAGPSFARVYVSRFSTSTLTVAYALRATPPPPPHQPRFSRLHLFIHHARLVFTFLRRHLVYCGLFRSHFSSCNPALSSADALARGRQV